MHLKNKLLILPAILITSFLFMSWGYNGHYKISYNASMSFNPEMEQFMNWAVTLAQHASDADERKATDPDEGPRHYIDIDNYPGFAVSGRIPQTYDSVVTLYGTAFVISQGILPWATLKSYDSLVSCFARFDWEKAVLFASDLGHYVADGHMPMHITRNYNGQYTGNSGIHSRYESTMINTFNSQIVYQGDSIMFVADVSGYIFNYLYDSYTYVDSVLAADNYAKAIAGNTTSYVYKEALWNKSKSFTIPLFSRASNALAELIYSAWVEAGKPDMNSGPGIFEKKPAENIFQMRINPNPVKGPGKVSFNLKEESDLSLEVLSANGAVLTKLSEKKIPAGDHEFSFNVSHLPDGIYFFLLKSGKSSYVTKAIKITSH